MEKRKIEAVDSTILGTLDECPRKCQYRFEFGLVQLTPSVALEFGKAYHQGLGRYYETQRNKGYAIQAFMNNYPYHEGEELRTTEKGIELLEAYDTLFKEEDWEYLGGEQQFVLELMGVRLPYVGFIDGFGQMTYGDEAFAIQEWKTTSSPWNFCAYPNGQIVGYCLGASTHFMRNVTKALVTVAGVFKSSKGGMMAAKKKGEPPRNVVNREIIDLSPWDFEEWQEDVEDKVNRLLVYEELRNWPKNTRSCQSYGGCPYKILCQAPENMREMLMETNYRVEVWEPLMERR